MHPMYARADELSHEAIAAGIEVHRALGPGLLESIYHWAMVKEFEIRRVPVSTEQFVQIRYKGFTREEALRYDLLIANCLLIEVKAVEKLVPIHKAQLLSYMRLLNVPLGLLLNFHEERLASGIARLILPGANQPDS